MRRVEEMIIPDAVTKKKIELSLKSNKDRVYTVFFPFLYMWYFTWLDKKKITYKMSKAFM